MRELAPAFGVAANPGALKREQAPALQMMRWSYRLVMDLLPITLDRTRRLLSICRFMLSYAQQVTATDSRRSMPKEIVARLNQAVGRILKTPDMQERLSANGLESGHGTPEEFNRFIAQEIVKYTQLVKDGNIRSE